MSVKTESLIQTTLASARGISLDDKEYIVVAKNGEFFVYLNRCPHLNTALNDQDDQFLDPHKNFIRCARHNALFTIDQGLCIKGPCNGQKLQRVSGEIVGGQLLIES